MAEKTIAEKLADQVSMMEAKLKSDTYWDMTRKMKMKNAEVARSVKRANMSEDSQLNWDRKIQDALTETTASAFEHDLLAKLAEVRKARTAKPKPTTETETETPETPEAPAIMRSPAAMAVLAELANLLVPSTPIADPSVAIEVHPDPETETEDHGSNGVNHASA